MKAIWQIVCLGLVTALLIWSTTLYGQSHNWTRTNPGGGGLFSTVGAGVSGIVIAGSDLSGAYRSLDGGMSWDVIGVSKGMTETHVSGVGFDRIDGDILYIGTENGIFRSTDGGDTVSRVLLGGYITDIEFGTAQAYIGYASYHPEYNSNQGVVYKTTDRGLSWSPISTDLPAGLRILKIIVNPNNADTVYALSGEGRFACGPAALYRSTNGGINWTNTTGSLKPILDAAIDPKDPTQLYVTTLNADCDSQYYWFDMLGSLYKSSDAGNSWVLRSDHTGVIWIDRDTTQTIRLIDPREPYPWEPTAGTWTSTDGGLNFSRTGDVNDWDTFFNNGSLFWSYGSSRNGICKTLGEDLSDKNNYYWVNSQWIFKTSDKGTIFLNQFTDELQSGWWQSRGFDNINHMDVDISAANPDIIFIACFDIGLWRSLDGGDSWQSCNDSIHSGGWDGYGGNCATVLTDPDRSQVVWATMSGQQNGEQPTTLLKSNDKGEKHSWSASDIGLPNQQLMGLSMDKNSPVTNRTLYITAETDVYKSTDDGQSWTKVFDCNGCRFTAVDAIDGDKVYAGGEAGFFSSHDGGLSWIDYTHQDMPATAGRDFWSGDYDGVFDVIADPNVADRVYVTALGVGKGLYRSNDGGQNWQKILTDNYMRKVAVKPQNSDIVYATSSSAFEAGGFDPASNGIWFSDDGGQHWTQQNQGMAYPFALGIAINNLTDATVFVGSPGTGFQRSPVPDAVLPVRYINDLEGVYDGLQVVLHWATGSEYQSDVYEVYRSDDAVHWDKIGAVESAGQAHAYFFIDKSPKRPLNYYRLKQLDKDGNFSLSKIIIIKTEGINTIIYPNPVNDRLYLERLSPDASVKVIDKQGKMVYKQKIQDLSYLDLSDLAGGVYTVVILSKGRHFSIKIIKK